MNFSKTTWVEISKSAFEHNVALYRSLLPSHIKMALVLKANAYGHDINVVAGLIKGHALINVICVNSLSEALLLREKGIKKTILVLSLIDQDPLLAIDKDIELVAYSLPQLIRLNELACKIEKMVKVHLKVDTGMSRLGFLHIDFFDYVQKIKRLSYIKINGVFSHFAESSSGDLEYTYCQAARFESALQTLQQEGIAVALRHLSNSAASALVCCEGANMVRLGAGPFGLYPSSANKGLVKKRYPDYRLKQVLSWKVRIILIKKVEAGSFVGYARSFKTTRPTIIACLPVGYYEGYPIGLSNKGTVFLSKQQKYAPVVGMVCMNLMMIDVTDVDSLNVGDEVVIVGNDEQVSMEKIGNIIESYNLRKLTGHIISTLPRVLVD